MTVKQTATYYREAASDLRGRAILCSHPPACREFERKAEELEDAADQLEVIADGPFVIQTDEAPKHSAFFWRGTR